MAYVNSVSLAMANKIFNVVGVFFEENHVEGGYMAIHKTNVLRRRTLTECCTAVLTEWLTLKPLVNTN